MFLTNKSPGVGTASFAVAGLRGAVEQLNSTFTVTEPVFFVKFLFS